MGCYTAPGLKNCCGEPGSLGHEAIDAEFFAEIGCDHIMSDYCQPYTDPGTSKAAYAKLGAAIANSSNPNMVYGVWHTGRSGLKKNKTICADIHTCTSLSHTRAHLSLTHTCTSLSLSHTYAPAKSTSPQGLGGRGHGLKRSADTTRVL